MFSELWSDLRYRARALFNRRALERELDDELRFHIECEAEKYERAGVPRAEAMRRARLAFGGVDRAKEESRDARGTLLLETALQDVRYALRGLRARPSFTVGVMLTLGLGIGANAAMFGIVDRLLFRTPEHLTDADRVHRVYFASTSDNTERIRVYTSYARYLDLLRETHSFSLIATFGTWKLALGDGDAAREVPVSGASASYFDFFDLRPALGRFFTAQEDVAPEGAPVVVLSYPYWQIAFGGSRDVLGKTIRVGRTLCTIIGVAPEGFNGIVDEVVPSMWVPITTFLWDARHVDYRSNYAWQGRQIIAKRKAGVSIAAATADLTTAFRRSTQAANLADPRYARPLTASRPHGILGPIQLERGPLAGPETKVATLVSAVALAVLLIACANVANLLLARAVTRRREIALRLALGVSRGRLLRQLATESLLLSLLGALVGLAIAQWGGAAIRALFLSDDVATNVLTDGRTLVATSLVTIGVALLTGLTPAMQALRGDLARALVAGGRDLGGRGSRARTTLLLVQATLSVVLLVGAGLFVRSFSNVRSLRLGFDVDPVLVMTDQLRSAAMSSAQRMTLERRLAERAREMPGVVAASPVSSVPMWGYEQPFLFVPGIDSVYKLADDFVLQAGTPDYFRAAGTRIVRGRLFTDYDDASAPPVAIVGEGMANILWPMQDPLGKCIRVVADTTPCRTVVGVAEDTHFRSFSGRREHTYYLPFAQYYDATGMLLVRVAGKAKDYVEPVRRELQRMMPASAYVTAIPFGTVIDPAMRSWRIGATMFVALGGLALALAAIGLYSVIAYGVAQRRQEIGVRIALGASSGSVANLVVRGALRLVVIGVALGSLIAVWGGKTSAALLFDESPTDPVVYGAVAAVLIVVSLVATAVPALGAARVDPNVVLRGD